MRGRRRTAPQGLFGSETELCAHLMDIARAFGYQAHAECSGWDILLCCRETGDQVGIQAKLRPGIDVLHQAMSPKLYASGPEVHAVLVPSATREFLEVARGLGILVLEGARLGASSAPSLMELVAGAQRWEHKTREWAPEVEVRYPAGVPSPKQITPWKLKAVKLCLLLRERGFVTMTDLHASKLDTKWWTHKQWGPILKCTGMRVGQRRQLTYVFEDPTGPLVPDLRWPEVVEALQARNRKTTPPPRSKAQPRRRVVRDTDVRCTIVPPPIELQPLLEAAASANVEALRTAATAAPRRAAR